MEAKIDILAIGGITIDSLFSVDRLPKVHFEATIIKYGDYYGGRAPNVAAVAAKLGLYTGVVSPVGTDFVSSGYKDHLMELGVDLSGVFEVADKNTKKVLIFTDVHGQQVTFFHYGAEQHFSDLEVPESLIERTRIVHISSSGDFNFNVKCARYAYNCGIQVSFDVGNDPFTEIPEYLQGIIPCTSFLFLNDVEVEGVLERMRLKRIDDLLETDPKTIVVINKRDKSSQIYTQECSISTPPLTYAIKDPTGMSDAYVAAFLAAVLRDHDLQTSGLLGVCMSSFVAEQEGSQTNLVDWNQLTQECKRLFNNEI